MCQTTTYFVFNLILGNDSCWYVRLLPFAVCATVTWLDIVLFEALLNDDVVTSLVVSAGAVGPGPHHVDKALAHADLFDSVNDTGWATILDHFWKFITSVYDDTVRLSVDQSIQFSIGSKTDVLNVTIFKCSLHKFRETLLHWKYQFI